MKIALDGSMAAQYRGECECGFSWFGEVNRTEKQFENPTLPIAECVVHMRMTHPGDGLQLVFTSRFENWLFKYWQSSGTLTEISNGSIKR